MWCKMVQDGIGARARFFFFLGCILPNMSLDIFARFLKVDGIDFTSFNF